MKVTVNGTEHELAAATLAEALAQLDYGAAVIATAVNGYFVPATVRATTALANGDKIEIVAPMQGG